MPGGAFSLQLRQAEAARDGAKAAMVAAAEGPVVDAQLGARLSEVVRNQARKQRLEDVPGREQDALKLLRALQQAYSDEAFQGEIKELSRVAGGNELNYLSALGPVAGRVQAPIFERYGLPAGQRGVLLMKMAVKAVSAHCPGVLALAGDLRELLGLPREEPRIQIVTQEATAQFKELVAKIARAPVDVRGPLAEALRLPYKATPEQIAAEVGKIRHIAEELADKNVGRPRADLAGDGCLLGPELLHATTDEVRRALVESFEHYLRKMLARVITSLESFTKPVDEFRCAWADGVIRRRHALELWGTPPASDEERPDSPDWLSLGVGLTVLDGVVDADLVRRIRSDLAHLDDAGEVHPSRDPCNIGARSVWLHFETEEERKRLPLALLQVCLCLAGLPAALHARVDECDPPIQGAPRLRLHPHVMAATYRRGAEYHVHKDSYNGQDNQRMVTMLLYLNHDWRPGDGGELRVFKTTRGSNGAEAPDQGAFVDIAPLCGRLVMFRSREVWHAVREPREQRWALTLWVMAD